MAANRSRSLSRDGALEQGALWLCGPRRRRCHAESAERPLPRLLVVGADEILLSDLRRRPPRRLPAPLPNHRRECAAGPPPVVTATHSAACPSTRPDGCP